MTNAPRWTEIKLAVPMGWQELVAETLAHTQCTTVAIGDHSIASEVPPEGHVHLRSYVLTEQDNPVFRADLEEKLRSLITAVQAPELQSLTLQFKALPPEDFATSWRKSWKPFRLRRGERALVVQTPWSEYALQATETLLTLEPGGAFGSGRHATTRTCMGVALERMRGNEKILDAGSGSGILSVAGLLLGAQSAFGFDIDEIATQSAQELARNNGVGERARFATGGFECLGQESYDVVFANIYSDVIQANKEALHDALRPGGWFAFSGCPFHHVDATREAIGAANLNIQEERRRGRWFTFVGGRK